ncbi:unnamed protein product [Mytilus coruscus]|uniref:BEN domain-containing protein n=1 Tax=Mytilus coruscus TaxID=42192 RepID=A0A6J8C0C9_MYTCO|nr:unnamed protein product [Mytilus coruscus]
MLKSATIIAAAATFRIISNSPPIPINVNFTMGTNNTSSINFIQKKVWAFRRPNIPPVNLVFLHKPLKTQESENTQRISTAHRSLIDAVEKESDVPSPLPSHSSRLPDMPVTPTTSHISTLEQRNTFSPAFRFNISTPPMRQTLTVPYSLFSDIPEQFVISENDLSRAIHSSKGPGNFACHNMPILFPELLTSDNLRTMYTFYGGGKLNKNPLNRQKREFLRRYVVTVYPEVMCDKAFNERVISKVNQLLRRPIHRK